MKRMLTGEQEQNGGVGENAGMMR